MAVTNWTDLYCTNTNYFTPAGGYYAPILPTAGGLPNWVNDLVDALRIWPADMSANGHNLNNLGSLATSGSVGIGTPTPGAQLDVVGVMQTRRTTATDVGGTLIIGHGAYAWQLIGNQSIGGDFMLRNPGGSNVVYLPQSGGQVGIGTGAMTLSRYVHIAPGGPGSGLGIGWNFSGGNGETNFFNHAQGATLGGFSFFNYSLNGATYPTSAPAVLMQIGGGGDLTLGRAQTFTNNAAAVAAGLPVGTIYRITGSDNAAVVH